MISNLVKNNSFNTSIKMITDNNNKQTMELKVDNTVPNDLKTSTSPFKHHSK